MAKEWYVIHTYSGHENKVKLAIEKKAKNLGLEDKIGEIKIPTFEDPYIAKNGKKKVRLKKIVPGYILIEMELDDFNWNDIWNIVRNTPGVTHFVGATGTSTVNKPQPLKKSEVNALLFDQVGEHHTKERVSPVINFSIGEHIKVIDGPFNNFSGVIEEIYPEKGRLWVKVEIFGRGTPVELDFIQVGKL
jgi:transcription termination/antitermination protein NusG